jgi:hypothetical protein
MPHRNYGMSDEPKKWSRKWIAWTVVALFVLYPLSEGPALWLAMYVGTGPAEDAWRSAYAPILWARLHSDDIERAANRYDVLWVGKDQ